MNLDITTVLSVYGAAISTVALTWQVIRWQMEKPQIKVTATHCEIELYSEDSPGYIEFEIRNRGRVATTIEEIYFVEYANFWMRFFKIPQRTEYLSTYHKDSIKLPLGIEPGGVWKGGG